MTALIDFGKPNFYPGDIPTVQLTMLGRAFASRLRFPEELEEAIPKFYQEKAAAEAARRKPITENWFSAKELLAVQQYLYKYVSVCTFRDDVETGILKATKRVLRWDDLAVEIRDEDLQRISSLLSWCLLMGIVIERQRKLSLKEALRKLLEITFKKWLTRKKTSQAKK